MLNRRRLLQVVLLCIGMLALASCAPLADPQTTLAPQSDSTKNIFNLTVMIFWVALAIFVIVEGMLIYSAIRFRQGKREGLPVQIRGNTRLELAWTIAPAIIMAVIFITTLQSMQVLAQPATGGPHIQAIGHQWWWEFRYPDLGVVTANELHIPVNEQISVQLESVDVMHNWWVPRLSGKIYTIPGHINQLPVFTAEQIGMYWGQCAEFCGAQHAHMRFKVFVESRADFDKWVASQQAVPAAPAGVPTPAPQAGAPAAPLAPAAGGDAALITQGGQLFSKNACIGCHAISGTLAVGAIGPNLTHVGSRTTIAAGTLDNTPENLARWIRNPQAVKSGALMPNLGLKEDDITAIVAYLESLK